MITELEIAGYRPGTLADVVRLHMNYYGQEWGFGLAFETKVAGELAAFLSRFIPDTDLFLAAYHPIEGCVGSISVDCQNAASVGAHIRWFIVDQKLTGYGIGKLLMTQAIQHCDSSDLPRSYLTTFEGLHAARYLYESFDYKMTEERDVDQWAGGVKEQLFVRDISP